MDKGIGRGGFRDILFSYRQLCALSYISLPFINRNERIRSLIETETLSMFIRAFEIK